MDLTLDRHARLFFFRESGRADPTQLVRENQLISLRVKDVQKLNIILKMFTVRGKWWKKKFVSARRTFASAGKYNGADVYAIDLL